MNVNVPRAICAALAVTSMAAAVSHQPPPPAPIILISVDTLRADHLGSFGYHRYSTPHIDSLCKGATVFTQIESQVPLTLPSHVCLMTSTYPFANGIEENDQVLAPGAVTLATLLKSRGYRTAAFIGGYFLAQRFGLDQGFDLYDAPFGDSNSLARALDLKRPAPSVTRAAMRWLKANSGAPFFIFIHFFDLHRPYDPPARLNKRYGADQYDAEVGYVDEALGSFWNFLARQKLFDKSLIIFTSDHGESLGDHGESTHGYFIYQSTLHVPLIIHWPQDFAAHPVTVDAPAGLIDVAPTILQYLGIPIPSSFQGQSLLGLLDVEAPAARREVYSESLYAYDRLGFAPLRSLRVGNQQYIEAPGPELYNLGRDPQQLCNLAPRETDLSQSFDAELRELRSRYHPANPPVKMSASPRVASRLRALGYVATSIPSMPADESGPDPKDRLAEYRQYLRGTHLLSTGNLPEAEATFKEILSEDDTSLPSRYDLALCYLRQQRLYDTINQLKSALAADPRYVEAGELMASIWLQAGQYARARAELHNLLPIAPENYNLQYDLGVVAVRQGRPDDAIRHFLAALRVQPFSADSHLALGQVYLERQQWALAQGEFAQAVRIRPRSAPAYCELGLALEKQNRPRDAAAAFRQAIKCDPKYGPARMALRLLESGRG